jgi:uroporphyrinogen decarboxylase
VTSREVVRKTLAFENPTRVAHSFEPSDLIVVWPEMPNSEGEWQKINDREWRRRDEWGNLWGRIDETSKGEVVRGALENLDQVDTFPLPDFSNSALYIKAKESFAAYLDKWHVGHIHGFTFSVARKLRRLDQYLMDLLLATDQIRVLHDRVDEQVKFQMKRMREVGADSVMIAEDWGTQTRTLISPDLWRAEFKPRFVTLCDYAHSLELKLFMHSCGQIGAIVPDLIEAGVDLFQFDQPRLHGLDTLRAWQDQGQVTFWCPVDIQVTLQTKDESLIRQDAGEMIDELWQGRGGFIAGFYEDNVSIGLESKWQEIACHEFLKKGRPGYGGRI